MVGLGIGCCGVMLINVLLMRLFWLILIKVLWGIIMFVFESFIIILIFFKLGCIWIILFIFMLWICIGVFIVMFWVCWNLNMVLYLCVLVWICFFFIYIRVIVSRSIFDKIKRFMFFFYMLCLLNLKLFKGVRICF